MLLLSLDELGISAEDLPEPVSGVVCILKSGAQIQIETPLSPEDVMTIWNSKKRVMKIPTCEHSYAVIKKHRVDFLHAFIPAN